jgi:hypothetical protein
VISLPENVRERDQVATRPAKALRLVDLLSSEGIVNLPTSVFLESMRLRSWQSLADTGGAHAMNKAGNSTPCDMDRLAMIGKVAKDLPKS